MSKLSTHRQPKADKIVNLEIERLATCNQCGAQTDWQIITKENRISILDDIRGVECSMCGFRVDFDE